MTSTLIAPTLARGFNSCIAADQRGERRGLHFCSWNQQSGQLLISPVQRGSQKALRRGGVTMTGPKVKLVGVGGTLRKASCNVGLLRAGLEYANTFPDVEAVQADISKLPMYNGDLETRVGDEIQFPPEVEEFRDLIDSADAYLFAVPEYNYSLPAALKNAIDWASRPPNCFADKSAAIVGAGGGQAAVRAAYHLRQVGVFLDLHFVNKPELFVHEYAKPSPFAENGDLTDETTRERVHKVVDALRKLTIRLQEGLKAVH